MLTETEARVRAQSAPRAKRLQIAERTLAAVLLAEVGVAVWSTLVLARRAINAAGLDGRASEGVASRTAVIIAVVALIAALTCTVEALWFARAHRSERSLRRSRTLALVVVTAAHAGIGLGAAALEAWWVMTVAAIVATGLVTVWRRRVAWPCH